jgi:hypothetical protein
MTSEKFGLLFQNTLAMTGERRGGIGADDDELYIKKEGVKTPS